MKPPPDFNPNLAWQIAIVFAFIAFVLIILFGCASAPMKLGTPHSIQTNRFLAVYEIRLRGTEESVIVGRVSEKEDRPVGSRSGNPEAADLDNGFVRR